MHASIGIQDVIYRTQELDWPRQVNNTISSPKSQSIAHFLLLGLAIALVTNIIVICATYVLYPGYLDTGEPNIVALGWRLWEGNPVYLPLDHETRITNLYGPYLYSLHAIVLGIFGPSVLIGKLPGAIAMCFAVVCMAVATARHGRYGIAIAVAGTAAFGVLNLPTTIWNRPESFMLLTAAAGVALYERGSKYQIIIGIGILIGLSMGLKIFAAIYFAPIGLMILIRYGFVAALLTVLIAFAVAALPFLTPYFSFNDMVGLIKVMADKPNAERELGKIFRYGLYYVLPVVVMALIGLRHMDGAEKRQNLILFCALLASIVLVLYPAQKPGAGYHYFLPFAPLTLLLVTKFFASAASIGRKSAIWIVVTIIAAMSVLSIPTEKRFFRALDWQFASAVAAEIKAINDAYPDSTIEIGVGERNESYRQTFQRTRLVFNGHPYTLDAAIIIDTTVWGKLLPPGTIEMIRRCQTEIWLIPANEDPFTWTGFYGNDVYGQPFRDAFNASFSITEEREFFDVYSCRK